MLEEILYKDEIGCNLENWRVKNIIKKYSEFSLKLLELYRSDIKYSSFNYGTASCLFITIINHCFEYLKDSGLIRFKSSFYSSEKLQSRLWYTADRYVVSIYNGSRRVGYVSNPLFDQYNINSSVLNDIVHGIWYCFRMMITIDEQEINQKIAYDIFEERFIKKVSELFDEDIELHNIFVHGI